jgi:hypothetical protein
MLLDVGALGFKSGSASDRLLARGKLAATPMRHWGVAQRGVVVNDIQTSTWVNEIDETSKEIRNYRIG